VRGLKWLALLAVVTTALAVAAACNRDDEDGEPTSTPGAVTTQSPSTGTPAGTPTIEPRPTLTPGAYAPPPGSANVFGNPGFEEETAYWFALHEQTVQTSEVAHSGLASAHLMMRDGPETTGANVHHLVQEVAPAEFPELISGYYRIDNWKRATEKQYLQFVVIVLAPTNLEGGFPNYQVRYPLVGISEQPLPIGNAFFKFLTRDFEPRQGEWVYFESNIKNDFQELWKAVPEGYSMIRVLFEVRYDDKEAGLPAQADVYYDDLYTGPADANPNTP
jgi:hypothetical protein